MHKTTLISIYISLFTTLLAFGQPTELKESVIPFIQDVDITIQNEVIKEIHEDLYSYSEQLEKSGDKSRFLKKLFYKTQREHLVNYANNAQLTDLFIGQNKFDCVTGTALYALMLDALEIDYSIKETDFHVYLIVQLDGKDLLFEATDPVYGFITDPTEIGNRIRDYRNGRAFGMSEPLLSSNDGSGPLSITFYRDRSISLLELAGLQYYNLATNAFNKGNHDKAIKKIEIAMSLYPNDRFIGFRDILRVDMAQSMSTIDQ